MKLHFTITALGIVFGTLTSCITPTPVPQTDVPSATSSPNKPSIIVPTDVEERQTSIPTLTSTPTSTPPRLLTICMGREPDSLFLYGDASIEANNVLQAIYDGPIDMREFQQHPVILERIPSLAGGDAILDQIQVELGELIVDIEGNVVVLNAGVTYRPSECAHSSCAQVYSGDEPVVIDQLVLTYRLLPGIFWSDGTPLSADDSLYSYELAKDLFSMAPPESVRYLEEYKPLDDLTLEWRGLPGYQGAHAYTFFFSPLPRHAWGENSPQKLMSAEISTRKPLGWGAYVLDEWVQGDHISLHKNPYYFRRNEGLPYYDHLVYRFVKDSEEALTALLIGECDFVDQTAMLERMLPQLLEYQDAGRLDLKFQTGTAWEQIVFGIDSLDEGRPEIFMMKEARQAITMCIDRNSIADNLSLGQSIIPATYVSPSHPQANLQVRQYPFDPTAAIDLFEVIGWIDHDLDPSTARIARNIPDVPDGTEFRFTYLTLSDEEHQFAAQIVKVSLAECGIDVEVVAQDWDVIMAPGPDGPIFGRKFDLAQFAWTTSFEPACILFTSNEIPGPYPDFPKSWGGGNASGYSDLDFDTNCRDAVYSLPDVSLHTAAHSKAQEIFAEDLPVIPLYMRSKLIAKRTDICGVVVDPMAKSALWNLEMFSNGDGCQK